MNMKQVLTSLSNMRLERTGETDEVKCPFV